MTDRQDIWRHLKDHEAFPPQQIFARLQQMLESENTVPASAVQLSLERLQKHEVLPPLFLGRQIEKRLGLRSRAFGEVRWYLSAAACLLLALTGWMIYRSHTTGPRAVALDNNKGKEVIQKGSASLPADTLLQKDTSRALAGEMTTDTRPAVGDKISVRPVFSIEGHTLSATDNDLLVTFTSFAYQDVPAYLTRNTDKPLKINIDQYTHLYVSKNMLSMMKQTYEVLPNGKPARKARRMKRRLDNWKEKDQRRFDKGKSNPLDPLDLAEFIFR